ncbi:MAG: hypothetical protein N2379_10885 [Verrucomicrobiae bacterium]|nr:hypothetical protein [Verrucomicrobiae bacterium]
MTVLAIEVPWEVTSPWLYGLVGFLLIAWTGLATVNQARKLFGRRAAFWEEFESLRAEMRENDMQLARRLENERDRLTAQLLELQSIYLREVREVNAKLDRLNRTVWLICGKLQIAKPGDDA